MIQKITLNGVGKNIVMPILLLLTCWTSNAQLLYSNGGLSTGSTSASGIAAPSGYTWSEVQNDAGNTTESNISAGSSGYYVNAGTTSFQLGDNFTVPTGQQWEITSFDFYGYQTNYLGATAPIDQLRVQIWNGEPQLATSTVVAGNMTSNVLNAANSAEAMMYRLFNSTTPAPGSVTGTTRKIWKFRADITTTLQPGTYWVVYQVHAINDAAIFFPTATVAGTRGLPGWNAKINTVAATGTGVILGWQAITDKGNPDTAPDIAQDMPFDINGTFTLGIPSNALADKVSVYPNPVVGTINISSPENLIIETAEIIDMTGKMVKGFKVSNLHTLDVSELMSGSYILKLKSQNETIVRNFIKE